MIKRIFLSLAIFLMFLSTASAANNDDVVQNLKDTYNLQQHSEGGWFAEIYTAPFKQKKRATADSIYFLLDKEEVSHFHQLNCDEIWFYHAGCGMKITVLNDGRIKEFLLGIDTTGNECAMVVIPAGAIFAAENIDKTDYTFISCVTTPQFRYKGFRLVTKAELKKICPHVTDEILRLAYEKV